MLKRATKVKSRRGWWHSPHHLRLSLYLSSL